MSMLASLLANDSTAQTRQLVGERSGVLSENTQSIDAVGLEAENLRQCLEALERANTTIVGILAPQEKSTLTQQQIAEMLRKLTSVLTTDVPKLTADLKQLHQNKVVLRDLVQKMRDLKSRCEAALARLEGITTLDAKSIQDLTVLRGKAIAAGTPPTCRNGSVLL